MVARHQRGQGQPASHEATYILRSETQKQFVAELDDELLQVLGEDPSKANTPGKDIQSDLGVHLQHIHPGCLKKPEKKSKYLLPGNCTLINSLDLNADAKAVNSDTVYKRDQGIKTRQKQTVTATSCLAESLTMLLSVETRNTTLIKLLMASCYVETNIKTQSHDETLFCITLKKRSKKTTASNKCGQVPIQSGIS
ncbi:unnamed protein product [Pieris macdunnoughi]|uniref:Uncharacterized protein n=1 Tax=Pieris macdunnoughi TaxID=345717 RepID=A0A821MAY9_9NEOP|nr:unnamed protein product [Pieris macdunnoughi]